MDCFDNNLGNNIKDDAWNLDNNVEKLKEILKRKSKHNYLSLSYTIQQENLTDVFKFDKFMVENACVKLDSVNNNIFTSTKFI